MSLGAWGHLGTTLGSQRLTYAFQASILEDFSSKWGSHSEPKNHTGGFQVARIGACNDVFSNGFFRTYILHQIKYPKLIQKDAFFGPLDMAEAL